MFFHKFINHLSYSVFHIHNVISLRISSESVIIYLFAPLIPLRYEDIANSIICAQEMDISLKHETLNRVESTGVPVL